jgi:hypothetical protein
MLIKDALMKNLTPQLIVALLGVLIMPSLSSCAANANGQISANGALTLRMEMTILPAFGDYLKDLQETMGNSSKSAELFDAKEIRTVIDGEPAINLTEITIRGNTAILDLQIPSLASLSNSDSLKGLIDFRNIGATNQVSFLAGPKLMAGLLAYVRPGDVQSLEYVLPGQHITSTQQYREQLIWSLEDYASPQELEAMFAASVVRVELQVPRPIRSVQGAQRRGDRTIIYQSGVLELMTLRTDHRIEVNY